MADRRTEQLPPNDGTPVRFVALGGSAGSLEAFEQFFPQVPPDTGMAFIVISHLEPGRKTLLPEILQRKTAMPVELAADGDLLRPNRVYVAPPNRELAISGGKFQVLEIEPSPHRMAIDFFLRHLAEDQKSKAVGIIFSGMDNDGCEGLKVLKDHLGLVMVQDPSDAKFDHMPRGAVETGLADIVAPAHELAGKLLAVVAHVPDPSHSRLPTTQASDNSLLAVFRLLRTHAGVDFALYKRNTVLRRIERRMGIHQLDDLEAYVRLLTDNRQELDLLFKELLIGVTSFFRDGALFELLVRELIPDLLRDRPASTPLRVWTPGCSTGEETYSMAIALQECMDALAPQQRCPVQIFGTDLDGDAIQRARKGSFPATIATDVSPERLARFFQFEEGLYRVKKPVRDSIVFAPQNLLADPPFTRLDILCCRNLLIYLSAEVQRRLMPLFQYALNPGGLLVLGSSETVGQADNLFHPVNHKLKVYRRKPALQRAPIDMPLLPSRRASETPRKKETPPMNPDLPEAAQRALLETVAPPAVVTTGEGDIVYVNGRTGQFLEPASGKVNWNVFAMAREGLREELGKALRACAAQHSAVVVSGLKVQADAETLDMDLVVRPLHVPEAVQGLYLIVFHTAGVKAARPLGVTEQAEGTTVEELQVEVRQLRERLQDTVEDRETAQEELRSANEELQSNNEELQSTNEELTTSKEELQSLNEEMQTVNAELQSKVDELCLASDDMKNLLNGTEIATVFLDRDLRVKRFTHQATRIVNLIPTDIGRPMAHIVTNLQYDRLIDDAAAVLEGLVPKEMQVRTKDNRWFQARILPYRTADNVIDGVVLTFSDITVMKRLEESLLHHQTEAQEAGKLAECIIATLQEPLLVLDKDLRVISASPAFFEFFRTAREQTLGRPIYDLAQRQWNTPELRRLLEDILPSNTELRDYPVKADFAASGKRTLLLNARRVARKSDGQALILLAIREQT